MWICVEGVERWWSIRYEILPKRRCRGRVFEGDFAIREDLRTVVLLVMREKIRLISTRPPTVIFVRNRWWKNHFWILLFLWERWGQLLREGAQKNVITRKIHWAKKQALTIGWSRQMDKNSQEDCCTIWSLWNWETIETLRKITATCQENTVKRRTTLAT